MKKNFIQKISFISVLTFLLVMSSYSLVFAQGQVTTVTGSTKIDVNSRIAPNTPNQTPSNTPVQIPPNTSTKETVKTSNTAGVIKLKNPLKPGLDTIPKIINAILDGIVIPIAVPIFILAIIWTGILFVIAQGKPEGITNAKKSLKWTLIGGAVILGAKLISSAIAGTLAAITGTVVK